MKFLKFKSSSLMLIVLLSVFLALVPISPFIQQAHADTITTSTIVADLASFWQGCGHASQQRFLTIMNASGNMGFDYAFYKNSSANPIGIYYKYKQTGGVTWSTASEVFVGSAALQNFALDYNLADNKIHIVNAYSSWLYGINYKRGTPAAETNGAISWDAVDDVPVTVDASHSYTYPFVIADANGYPWFGYVLGLGDGVGGTTDAELYVTTSSTKDGTWTTRAAFPYMVNTLTGINLATPFAWCKPAGFDNGNVYIAYTWHNAPTYGRLWNEATDTMGAEETIIEAYADASWKPMFSSAIIGSEVIVSNALPSNISKALLRFRSSGGAWSNNITMQGIGLLYPTIGSDLYYFFESDSTLDNTHIYYQRFDPTAKTLIDANKVLFVTTTAGFTLSADGSGSDATAHQSTYKVYASGVGYRIEITWMEKETADGKWDYKFSSGVNTYPGSAQIGQFSSSAASTYKLADFTIKARVQSSYGVTSLVNATVQINGSVLLRWINSTNTFSVASDPSNYVNFVSGSRTTINGTTYELNWVVQFTSNAPNGFYDVFVTNTIVYNNHGASGTGSKVDVFQVLATNVYTLYGAYYEHNNLYAGAVNITLYLSDNSIETHEVSTSPLEVGVETNTVTYATWPANRTGSVLYRRYYPDAGEYTIRPYVTAYSPYPYTIYVLDLKGDVVTGTTKLKVIHAGAGVEKVVEKVPIPSTYKVDVSLATYNSYIREVIDSEPTTHRDTMNTGVSYTDTMTIVASTWDDTVLYSFKYARVQSIKNATANAIVTSYWDNSNTTSSITVYYYFANGTLAYNQTVPCVGVGSATISWTSGAGYNSTLEYRVYAVGTSTKYGSVKRTDYLSVLATPTDPFTLTLFGSVPYLSYLVPYSIIALSGAMFSALSVVPGMFAIVAVAGILRIIGWLPSNIDTWLYLAFIIVIMVAINKRKKSEYGA